MSWSAPLHLSISPTPDLDLIPAWLIDQTVRNHLHRNIKYKEPERDIECYELDPYCFSPKINGIHGHIAYGNFGLTQLKMTLTTSRDKTEIGRTLNTLCELIRDPEVAMDAMKVNVLPQLRRLILHRNCYVRERTVQALKILSLRNAWRECIVNDDDLMDSIICCLKDRTSSVRRTTYDLLFRLSSNYFAVAKLMDYGFIKIIMEELKQRFQTEDEVYEEGSEIEEITEVKDGECGNSAAASLDKINESEIDVANEQAEEEEDLSKMDELQAIKSSSDEECEILDETDFVDIDVSTTVTLLETLANLMTFSKDATLDAICYDVLSLKRFLYHHDRSVRMITWNIFKQVFSTDIGQMALIPHNLLDDMMKPFDSETDESEMLEIMGTLMLALVKVENRVAAFKNGILDKIAYIAKQPSLSSNKRLAVLNVLTHLVEIPEVRTMLTKHLPDTVLAVNLDSPTIEHHAYTHLERTLWKP